MHPRLAMFSDSLIIERLAFQMQRHTEPHSNAEHLQTAKTAFVCLLHASEKRMEMCDARSHSIIRHITSKEH